MEINQGRALLLPSPRAPGPASASAESEKPANWSGLRLRLTRVMAVCILVTFACGIPNLTVTHPVLEKSLFFAGIALASFGAAGRAWATSYISGQKMKRLITTGPYSLCRNPLYFFSLILGIGFGFCTETVTMPILITVVLGLLYYFQIRYEEQQLGSLFGKEYTSYLATTPRFFPSFRHYSEPDEIIISPRLLKRGLFGIAFLLILIGAFELLEALHQSGVLPVLVRIY